ncbi:MAG: plasmid pRiA4b ORF-3 family protein [Cruoricaptor ignavus]|nr:plasmid pRiA4b ORF-3 family protein [Cruoricaptor ignavus]
MALEFKIKLVGSAKPPIWRKIKVNDDITFEDFHNIIQVVFNWKNYHLYLFSPRGWGSSPIIQPNPEEDIFLEEPVSLASEFPNGTNFNSLEVKLNQYFTTEKQKIKYIYDVGDDWEHEIVLEKITDEIVLKPICTAGKGQAPVEDCGGVWGYYNMVEAINDPKHEEHKDFMKWLGMKKGETWDVNEFSVEEVNDNINELF